MDAKWFWWFSYTQNKCVINVFNERLDYFLIILVMVFPRISGSWQFDAFLNFFFFLWPHLSIWKFPGQRLKWSCNCHPTPQPQPRQLWTASAMHDVRSSSWQHRILNPLSEARDQTCTITRHHVRFLTFWATMGTPGFVNLNVLAFDHNTCDAIKFSN